jgi:hypothetical protein
MPEHNDFDERLVQRLRAYESRMPEGQIPMAEPRASRSRSQWAAAGGVLALGALAGVVLALVLLNRPAPPTGESSPTPSASSSASPSVEASPSASESAAPSATATLVAEPYTTVVLGEFGSALAAASGPSGAVVVGYDDAGPAAWHSPDGRSWLRASLPEDAAADVRLTSVAASDLGYVAVAANCFTECFGGQLWYSADGMAWSGASTALTGGILAHLVAGGPGFVAIGIDPYAAGSPGVTPTVLTSADGLTWQASQPADLLEANVHALGSTGDLLVALGTRNTESGTVQGSWISADGIGWQRYDDADPNRAAAFELAWSGEELLAVGQGACPGGIGLGDQCPGEATMAWRSTDGYTWEPALADPCCGGLSDVAATPTGWVVIVSPRDPPFSEAPPALAGRIGEEEWLAVDFESDGELILWSVTVHDGLALFAGEVRSGDASQPVMIVYNHPLP